MSNPTLYIWDNGGSYSDHAIYFVTSDLPEEDTLRLLRAEGGELIGKGPQAAFTWEVEPIPIHQFGYVHSWLEHVDPDEAAEHPERGPYASTKDKDGRVYVYRRGGNWPGDELVREMMRRRDPPESKWWAGLVAQLLERPSVTGSEGT